MAYHHGDLKAACLEVLPQAIEDQGLEKLSLREVARRAGVSHGAPAHHFGDKRGLLTAFAVEGANLLTGSVRARVDRIAADDHPARLTAVGLGYLDFALARRHQFRVMYRPELLDMTDERLQAARARAGASLDAVLDQAQLAGALAARDRPLVRTAAFALAHGYASLALDVLEGLGEAQIKKQASSAFMLFSQRMLIRGA